MSSSGGTRVNGYKAADITIIFDPRTYAPLGEVWSNDVGHTGGEVLTRFGVVNKVGQLP